MVFPFLSQRAKSRQHIVAIDLGARTTKAVYLQKKGEGYCLASYTIQESPVPGNAHTPEALSGLLQKVHHELNAPAKTLILALSATDSLLRHVELTLMPAPDMRGMLKTKAASEKYLQQNLEDHVIDCFILPLALPTSVEPAKSMPKCKVMVGAARQTVVEAVQTAAKQAGFVADQIVPNLIGPANALEMAEPEICAKEVAAVVDLGFKHSTISILHKGELMLNRVVELGGDQITAGLAETMSVSYAEAEGLKIGMPQEVASSLAPLLAPLGRELRASLDFFEHQNDKTVSQIFVCGAAARSDFFIQTLQNELMVPCKPWNPTRFLEQALPLKQQGEIEQDAGQLTVAVGAAVAAF